MRHYRPYYRDPSFADLPSPNAVILLPIAGAAGINGIHFGMVMVLTFVLGGITPPVGVTLYIAVAVAKLKLGQLLKEMWPFILLFVAVMMLVAYVPMVCLFLPNLIGG